MKYKWFSALCIITFSGIGHTLGQPPPPSTLPTPNASVYQWLLNQQQPTGLLGNQEDDNFSGIYSVALASLAYMHQGHTERAEKAFDFYLAHFDQEFAEGTPGGFHQFWDAQAGTVHADTDRWLGDNAWLLIALNHYRQKTGLTKYDPLRAGIARWILRLQDADGGVWSGFKKDGPIPHKSTEANLDCYAALADYPEAREKILRYLKEKMWVPEENRFRMGSTVDESALDCGSWAVCALGPDFSGVLDYTERAFRRTDTSGSSPDSFRGFADFLNKRRIWWEGTGQMVVAFQVAGQATNAQAQLVEMEKALISSARFTGTLGLPCTTSDPAWEGATTRIFVPSQVWYLFGKWNFNPLSTPD